MRWHDVACPTCRARSGDFCATDGDVRRPQHDPHPERVCRADAEAERDALAARLAAVEAVAGEWDRRTDHTPDRVLEFWLRRIRAALEAKP